MAQHLSFRVPWHENKWDGSVCEEPSENFSCMRLKGINQGRKDELENEKAGCKFCELDCREDMPCIREGGAFMSPDEISIVVNHPYQSFSDSHKHLLPTKEIFPPYSYPARPFRWAMKTRWIGKGQKVTVDQLALEKGFEYHPEFEPETLNNTWVQDGRNQRSAFDAFFSDVKEDKSLCVFYAKQVPFVEDPRRVVVGIGHVKGVEPVKQYDSTDEAAMSSCLWENVVKHSIREDMKDGFLLPYAEMVQYAEEHEGFDLENAIVFAADDYFEEFSYAAEHLSHDAMIDVLLQCINTMKILKQTSIFGPWEVLEGWLNEQLLDVWSDRGAYPGLGPMLVAFGMPSGIVIARELRNQCSDEDDVMDLLDRALANPKDYLSELCAYQVNSEIRSAWNNLSKERRNVFFLMSRISLSIPQAENIYPIERRNYHSMTFSDADILDNPYILYEQTRDKLLQLHIPVKKVDLAVYPPDYIRDNHPLEAPTKMNSEIDQRRVRALAVSTMEKVAQDEGHTVLPTLKLTCKLADLNIEPRCNVTNDIVTGMLEFFKPEIEVKQDANGKDYYKLIKYSRIDHLVTTQIKKRVNSPHRHEINVDWRKIVDRECDKFTPNPNPKIENAAREEKAAALKTLAEARLSVLIGGAGTGKTTVLEILCNEPSIQNGGILLLAPTGKARVRMSQGLRGKVRFEAKTIAQFLFPSGRFNLDAGGYKILTPTEKQKAQNPAVPKTVIVDECSMITEDMFGALFDAISGAERIIFIGDYNQLPPIGAGRPFVDMVRYIRSVDEIGEKPMVGKNFAKLLVTNRQLPNKATNKVRSDVRLSKWYTDSDDNEELDENIFTEIQAGAEDGRIVFKQWSDKESLEQLLLESIKECTGMESIDDVDGFNRFLGGDPHHGDQYDGKTFYNCTARRKDGSIREGCAINAEKWQILSPVRNKDHGVLHMNHMIHERYRKEAINLALSEEGVIPKPMGADSIVYGDKVINVVNKQRDAESIFKSDDYVANGEIGMACSGWNQTKKLLVEFSSQQGSNYPYTLNQDFGDNGDNPLELAYALTVHKAQGSQFETVILVLSDSCRLMSKELLYTALTRQQDRIIILYDKEAYHLQKYSNPEYSDIARRCTDLFEAPKFKEHQNRMYEENLIHIAKDGTSVRSKSEVVIVNMLVDSGIEYEYEKPLILGSETRYPDFSFYDAASGDYIIWEHLGMLSNADYAAKWEKKKALYREFGYTEEAGTLIVTQDELDGGLNCPFIQEQIDTHLR